MFDAEKAGELLLKGRSFRAKGEPEIEGGTYGGFDFIFRENATCIRHGGFSGDEGGGVFCTGTVGRVHERGVLAREPEDFLFEIGGGTFHEK